MAQTQIIGTVTGKVENVFVGTDGTRKSAVRIKVKEQATGKDIEFSYDYKLIPWQTYEQMWGKGLTLAPVVVFNSEVTNVNGYDNYKIISMQVQPATAQPAQPAMMPTQPAMAQPAQPAVNYAAMAQTPAMAPAQPAMAQPPVQPAQPAMAPVGAQPAPQRFQHVGSPDTVVDPTKVNFEV